MKIEVNRAQSNLVERDKPIFSLKNPSHENLNSKHEQPSRMQSGHPEASEP